MHATSVCPLRVASSLFRQTGGALSLTLSCKATFRLAPGPPVLTPEQLAPNESEIHWGNDPTQGLYAPDDLSPFKPYPEVMLVGTAFAPGGNPKAPFVARLRTGFFDKSVEVFGDGFSPNGFGPLAASSPERRSRLGKEALAWVDARDPGRPIPADLDFSYFNVAPVDQRVEALRAGSPLVLDNLLQEHGRLVTSLPTIEPRVFVDRGTGEPQDVALLCDTLWIDTARGIYALTWRGQIAVDHPAQEGRIVVGMARPGEPLRLGDIDRTARPSPTKAPVDTPPPSAPKEFFRAMTAVVPSDLSGGQQGASSPGNNDAAPLWLQRFHPSEAGKAASPPPPRGPSPSSTGEGMASSSPGQIPQAAAPPAMIRPAPSLDPIAPPLVNSPWAGGALPRVVTPAPIPPLTMDSTPAPTPAAPVKAPLPAAPTKEVEPSHRAPTSVDPTELLWFDDTAAIHVRSTWRALLEDIESGPVDLALSAAEERESAARADIHDVLARAAPLDGRGLVDAASNAVDVRGRFTAPLAFTVGELQLSFEPVEILRVTVALLSPIAAADKKLKESIDEARHILDEPLLAASGYVEPAIARLREAFPRSTVTQLDGAIDRVLLRERRYQRRTLLGSACLRCLLVPEGDAPVTVYLPESLTSKLPLFARFPVRMIVEVLLPQDQFEAGPVCLRAVALGRVAAGLTGRGRASTRQVTGAS